MRLIDLPENVQNVLRQEKVKYVSKRINDGYTIHLYSSDGMRYVYARRHAMASQYMSFGGGSYWTIAYGKVQFESYNNPVGERDYRWCDGMIFGSIKKKDGSIVEIPKRVDTKKEVIEIIKSIGKFEI